MTMELLEGETTMEFYERALVERGPAIRARLGGMDDDGRHVFVATWPRSNGVDLIVWKTFEGLVGCIASKRGRRWSTDRGALGAVALRGATLNI